MSLMSDETKTPGSMALALLGGGVVLCTGPVTLAFLVVLGGSGEDGGFEGLARLFTDGGPASYAVLLFGALASLVGAVLMAVSVRRPGLPSALALTPFLLPMLAALGGVVSGMRAVTMAIGTVNPADRATILMAGTGELTSACVQALAFAASGVLCVALASLLTLGAPVRGARLVTALGSGTLAGALGLMTLQDVSIRSSFSALAHVSPLDRLTLLSGIIEDWRQLNHVSGAVFLASLVVAVVGAALVARRDRAAGIGAGVVLLVAAIGFRGFNALTERQLTSVSAGPLRAPLMTVSGHQPSTWSAAELKDSAPAKVDDEVLSHARRLDPEHPWIGVELRPELAPATLLRALQTAHFVRANVELVGDAPKTKLDAPPLFAAAVVAVGELQLMAPVRVAFTGEPCDGCKLATLTPEGLTLESERWKPEAVSPTGELGELPGVEVAWPGELPALVRASLTALSHGHVLVVRVPPPEPPPTLPDL